MYLYGEVWYNDIYECFRKEKIKVFFSGIKNYLLVSEEGSILWGIEQVINFIKAMWSAIRDRLTQMSEERAAKRDERGDS